MHEGVPPLRARTCQVWSCAPTTAERVADQLGPGERTRLARMRSKPAAARYIAAHALARLVVAAHAGADPTALVWDTTCAHCGAPHGKPRLVGAPGLDFSVSHSGGAVAVAVLRGGAVGVDVETLGRARDVARLAARILVPAEQAALAGLPPAARDRALLTYWARKEALVKATGRGLATPLRAIEVTAPDEPAAVRAWPPEPPPYDRASLTDLTPRNGAVVALAVLGPPAAVEEHDGAALLAEVAAERRDRVPVAG